MKKFILFFFAALLSVMTGVAREVVFDATVNHGQNAINENDNSYIKQDQSVTVDGVTIATPEAQWIASKVENYRYRVNKDSNFTITSARGNMVKVVFTCESSYPASGFGAVEGFNAETATWEGEAAELVFNASNKQVRISKIVVTIDDGEKLTFGDVVDGGVYGIVNLQPTGDKYYLESVDGVLTTMDGSALTGKSAWAKTAQYKAVQLEDDRFAFQNVATGEYLAWKGTANRTNTTGINGNSGFGTEINACTSWTLVDGTQFAGNRTYWFYVNARNQESDGGSMAGTYVISNAGEWNAWGQSECTMTTFSNNFGFVAVSGEVDFANSNIASIEQADFVEPGKWYLLKQKRNGVSPVYDAGVGATMKRAANDNVVVVGTDAADAVDYLLRFIPAQNDSAYNLQFANGHYWANTMTTTEEEPGAYNVYNINGEAGHIGINLFDMGKIVDNNGAGNTLAFWESGEVTSLNGNNDWTVWEVEFSAKTTAAADLKALVAEVEEAFAANNVAELGDNLITENGQFSSPFTEPSEGSINNLLDGDCATFWHSAWSNGDQPMHYHYLQVDLPEAVTGDLQVTVGRRSNNGSFCGNDNVVLLGVEASADGENYAEVGQIDLPLVNGEWYANGSIAVSGAKSFRFYNDGSNETAGDKKGQRGYWHAGEFQLNLVTTPALNAQFPEAAAALQEAIAAAKAAGANATEEDVAALQAAYDAYVAALNPVEEPETTTVATITAVFPNGSKHVVFSNGTKFTAAAEAPADAIVKFEVVERTEETLVLKAGDQYIHWTSGDDRNKSNDLDGLNEEYDETLNVLYISPADFAGALTATKNDWGQSQETVEGLYQIKGYGTNGQLFDFTLREYDDAWIAGDSGNYFFDTNWDGNGCRTSFFEINITEEGGELPFPTEGVAYKLFNKDAELYIKLTADAERNVELSETPDKIYFTAVEGGYTVSNAEGYVMGMKKAFDVVTNANSWKWCIANSDEALVWEIVEVDGGYALKGDQGHLGFDATTVGSYGFRDKDYASKHGIFTVEAYPKEDETVDPAVLEAWEKIQNLLVVADKVLKANQVTAWDYDDRTDKLYTNSPVAGKVGYKADALVAAVAESADYVRMYVGDFTDAGKCEAYWKQYDETIVYLPLLLENTLGEYNEAEVCMPEAGKTYVIRLAPNQYSWAYQYNNGSLGLTPWSTVKNDLSNDYIWTCEGTKDFYYTNDFLEDCVEPRFLFSAYNDASKYLAWKKISNADDSQSLWKLSGKDAPEYGVVSMQAFDGVNINKYIAIQVYSAQMDHGNGSFWTSNSKYSSWFYLEEVEPILTNWDESEPIVTVVDETTVTVKFNEAHKVEATNYGVLGAMFDESGDVVAVVFNDLFDGTVAFEKDQATLHFKKISEINAELAASAKSVAAKAAKAAGDVKGKVVICGKSFKIDEETIYAPIIVKEYAFGGQVTGIESVATEAAATIYDLAGRRVVKANKGLYIQEGTKVIK